MRNADVLEYFNTTKLFANRVHYTDLAQNSSQLVAVEVSALVIVFVLERRLLATTHTHTHIDSSITLTNLKGTLTLKNIPFKMNIYVK